jgi:hypothetical protein
MTTKMSTRYGYENLTETQAECLDLDYLLGDDGYPIQRIGRKWEVTGYKGIGVEPAPFKTKREAKFAWEKTLALLTKYNDGRLPNPSRV